MSMRWWTIARLELTLALRDRESLIWSLIAPIAMAWVFGVMFNDAPPRPTRVALDAGMNPPVVSWAIAHGLAADGMVIAPDGIRVQVPDSLLDRLADGRRVAARIHPGDASDSRAQAVSATTRTVLYRIAFAADSMRALAPGDTLAAARVLNAPASLSLDTRTLGTAPRVVTGAAHTLPAMLIMFIMFQLTTYFLVMWVDDLRTGKIKRIVMSPTPTRDLLLGQMTARLVWAAVQVAVILGVGSLVLGVRLEVPPFAFGAVLLSYMLAATSVGLLLGTCFRTAEKANAVGVIAALVMASLGGCWWPLEIVPGPMRIVASLFPTGQAMDALGDLSALGTGAPFPIVNVAVLVAMTLVMLPLAVARMRRQLTW